MFKLSGTKRCHISPPNQYLRPCSELKLRRVFKQAILIKLNAIPFFGLSYLFLYLEWVATELDSAYFTNPISDACFVFDAGFVFEAC